MSKTLKTLGERDFVNYNITGICKSESIVMKYKHQKRVFVELQGVGRYATAYVSGAWIRRINA